MEYRFTINQKTNIFFSEEDLLEHINLRKDLGFNDSEAIIEMERRLSLKNFLQKNEDFSTG